MNGVAALVLLLAHTCLGRPCDKADTVLICYNLSADFLPGFQTLLLSLSNVGEVNSAVLQSSNLVSVTRLSINFAGITGIAERAFGSFIKLTNVSLEGNMLSQINANWFANPAVIRELRLQNNLVEVVNESTLQGLPNLTNLSLRKNRIHRVHPQSFSSQSSLAELDLSRNNLTSVPPEVFRSLRSLRSISLDGNPWNCSCDHKDFVASVKALKRKSHLERPMNVTCETPLPLKGQPVWNVSVCPVPPPSGIPTLPTTDPTSNDASLVPAAVTSRPSQQTSKTETSFLLKPTDSLPTSPSHTGTFETSSLSGRDTSIHPKPTNTPVTPPQTTQPPGTRTVYTLVAVIVALCVLLFAVCFLAVLHRRKRSNKTVIPGCLKEEEKKKELEDDGRSSNDRSEERSDIRDPEMARKKSLTGVRAKSANAVILTSPFGSSVKNTATFQTRTHAPSESSEKPGDGKQKLESEGEAAAGGGGGGIQRENHTTTNTVKEYETRQDDEKNRFENPECVYISTDVVPYLSIGANQNNPSIGANQNNPSIGANQNNPSIGANQNNPSIGANQNNPSIGANQNNPSIGANQNNPSIGANQNNPSPEEESTGDASQRAQMSKVIGRVSTWPATAAQWLARCKMKEEGEDGEGITVWTQSEVLKLPDEAKKSRNKMNQPESSERCEKEDEREKDPSEADVNLRDSLTFSDFTTEERLKKEEGAVRDPAAVRHVKTKISQNKELKSGENPTNSKTEARAELKRSATGRQKTGNRAAGSKAASGGTSPDDETLLSGNEYAFMDLLHEVALNKGRWTRERWKQMHVKKQRR